MSALVAWFQRIASHGLASHGLPSSVRSNDTAEREPLEPDWTWIAMFPGDMPLGLMEMLVRSGRRQPGEQDGGEPRA